MCAVSLLSIGKLRGGFKPKLVTEEKGCAHEIKAYLAMAQLYSIPSMVLPMVVKIA